MAWGISTDAEIAALIGIDVDESDAAGRREAA
jgi:hypothetical protein